MKQKIILFTLLILHVTLFSQINGRVEYEAMLSKNSYAPTLHELTIYKTKSTFKTIKRVAPDKVIVDELTGVVTLNSEKPDSIQPYILSDFKKREIISKVHLSDNHGVSYKKFNVVEPIDMIWSFGYEEKKIGKYHCKKATTKFRGRTYNAWYAENIPLSVGPWKFHGLPGLIVEITDETNEVSFTLKKIQIPYAKEKINIDNSIYTDLVSINDFFKMKKVAREKSSKIFEMKILSRLPRGATMTLTKDEILDIEKSVN
ncbi:GLPGLI family protein [Tenacibaculum sp.]|nr:GLPGLI family protein [Tenacibaculum sp.]